MIAHQNRQRLGELVGVTVVERHEHETFHVAMALQTSEEIVDADAAQAAILQGFELRRKCLRRYRERS